MSSKMRMLIVNEIDNAELSVTTGTTVPALPVDNLKIYNNSRIFRSLSPANTVIVGNLADFTVVSALVIWRHNLSDAATLQLELFDDYNATGNKAYDSGVIAAVDEKIWSEWDWRVEPILSSVLDDWDIRYTQLFFDAAFCLSFKLTISDPLPPTPHTDITRLYLGRHFSPEVNFSYGSQQQYGSKETQFRTDDGSLFTQSAQRYRTSQFSLEHLSDADTADLNAALRHVGITRDFYISLHPNQDCGAKHVQTSYACKFTRYPALDSRYYNNQSAQFHVEEV